jgi:quinoprotein glucose dehydrogenase
MPRFTILILSMLLSAGAAWAAEDWSYYGGDEGGQRHSSATQISPANVTNLVRAWTFSSGDLKTRSDYALERTNLEVTPILAEGRLLMCTPYNEVIALHPRTGEAQWRFDPQAPTDRHYGNGYTCRGVTAWKDPTPVHGQACTSRVFVGTNDSRLIAVDLDTGKPCEDFGERGTVTIDPGMELWWTGEFQITSPPVIVGDVIVIGSSISDNERAVAPHGTVRAYDVRTGAPRWTWDPVPRDPNDPAIQSWGDGWKSVGHANVWAPMSADAARGLVFLPTSSASPDFFGGLRPGANTHSNSVVALHAATGTIAWSYQLVHHDVWDYDTPAQPTLATLNLDSGQRDVVIQGTKQGFVFVLDRDTGEPVFPVEERAVPQNGVAGEALSPTQPFPTHVPALVPQHLKKDDVFGFTPWDRNACRDSIASARSDGLFTPPTEQGTILFPFTGGGVNWGGVAFDPERQILFANTSRLAHLVTLFPTDKLKEFRTAFPDLEVSPQEGAAYGMKREVLFSPVGLPCNATPWGTLAAVDLKAGKILWESTLGTTESLAPLGITLHTGTPSFGGPLVTRSGLVFIGGTFDKYLRAFNAATGEELWQGRLPAAGLATPMTYTFEGRQYVVIAAGGRRDAGVDISDTIVAFALPAEGEAGPSLWSQTVDRPGGRFKYSVIVIALLLVLATGLIVRMRRKARVAMPS